MSTGYFVGQDFAFEYDSRLSCCHPVKGYMVIVEVKQEEGRLLFTLKGHCPIHGSEFSMQADQKALKVILPDEISE